MAKERNDPIQAKKDAIREALYQKPEGLDGYETGAVQKFDSLEQAGLASLGGHSIGHVQLYKRQSNGTKVWATQEEQKEYENLIAASKLQREQINESISRVYEQKGEAGLDELLRQNGVDPEKFTSARAAKAGSQSALPSPQNSVSQKRIAELQAKRENLLKQATPAKKPAMPMFNNRREKELFERYQFPQTAQQFKEWSNGLISPITAAANRERQEKFSEKALRAKPRASVFDMAAGGGTFSGYEMGNLGGNTLAKMMGDSLSVQRNMDNKLGLMLEELEEGGMT